MASQHDDKNHDKDDRARAHAAEEAQAAAKAQAAKDEAKPRARATHDTAAATAAKEENDKARANDSVGAQVVLDPASDAALAARGGAAGTIEDNTAIRNAALPRIIGLSHDTVGGTVTGKKDAPKLHRPVPWYEPPATGQTPAEVRSEAIGQIVSP
jgi:hypothetical protein